MEGGHRWRGGLAASLEGGHQNQHGAEFPAAGLNITSGDPFEVDCRMKCGCQVRLYGSDGVPGEGCFTDIHVVSDAKLHRVQGDHNGEAVAIGAGSSLERKQDPSGFEVWNRFRAGESERVQCALELFDETVALGWHRAVDSDYMSGHAVGARLPGRAADEAQRDYRP